jgi:phenylacetate-CoA ligase
MAAQGDLLVRKLRETGLTVRRLATNPPLGRVEHVRYLRAVVGHLKFLTALVIGVAQTDVVHVLGASWFYFLSRVAPSIVVARCLGRRVLVNYRGGEAERFLARHGGWAAFFIRRAHALTVPSAFLARIFASHGLPSVQVPNISDLERFRFRRRTVLAPRLLVNRNLEPLYNVALALDAFAQISRERSDAVLTIVGSGTLAASLRSQSERLGLQGVNFLGVVDNVEMPALIDAHDIYLNPTNVDNMPISILESLAAGLLVVSTNAGGIPDLISDGEDSLLVPPRDPDAMAAAVLSLLQDPELAARLAEAGVRKAQGFRWEAIRPQLLRVYAAPGRLHRGPD